MPKTIREGKERGFANLTPFGQYVMTQLAQRPEPETRRRDWLAQEVGVTVSTLSRWLRGTYVPTAGSLYRMANALGVDYAAVLHWYNEGEIQEEAGGFAPRVKWIAEQLQAVVDSAESEGEASAILDQFEGLVRLLRK